MSADVLDPRATMLQLASQVVGFGDNDATRDAYLDLLAGDGESEAVRRAMLTMSSCGLLVRALWRRLFSGDGTATPDPRLVAPYKIGSVLVTIEEMAREAGAWHPTDDISGGAYEPQAGDVFMVDRANPHVATITSTGAATFYPCTWRSIDGGQRDAAGRECIKERRRVVHVLARTAAVGGETLVAVADDGLSPPTARELLGVVDLEALFAHFGTVSL